MRGAHWRRVPWVLLSCFCSCLFWPAVMVPTTSPISSTTSLSTAGNEQTTTPSSSTSAPDTMVPSQGPRTQRTEATGKSQASMLTPLSTATPASSPSPNTATSGVPQETSSSAGTAPSTHSGIGHTPLTTSEVKTAPPSTDTTAAKTEPGSFSLSTVPTPVSSATSLTNAGHGQTTAPPSSTSAQDTAGSSQSQDAHGSETTKHAQTNMATGGDPSTSAFSSRGHSPTAAVPPGTSPSGWSTPSPHDSVSLTPLTTSEMTTAPTSIDTGTGTTQVTSVTAGSSPVTSTAIVTTEPEGQTPAPSLGPSPQDTSASAQTHHTGRTEPTGGSQASMLTALSTASPASSPSPNTPTSGVPQGTSSSAGTAPSSHSGAAFTSLTTSEIVTTPPSKVTTVANTEHSSWSLSTGPTPMSATSLTTVANGQTTAPSSNSFTQDTTLSSQSQDAHGTETTYPPQTNKVTVGDTSASAFSSGGSSPTAGVPSGTPPSAEPPTSSHASVSSTTLTTSEMMSVTGISAPDSSGTLLTSKVSGQTTAPPSSSSAQDTAVSSQSQDARGTQTTKQPQTSAFAVGDISTSAFSLGGSRPTAGLPPGTSSSGWSTKSPQASVSHTPLTTSEVKTAPPSTDPTAAKTEPRSWSLSTVTTSLSTTFLTTVANGQTMAPSSTSFTQDTAGSSQSHNTHGTETTNLPQTNKVTGGDTSASAFSSGGHSPTAAVPPGTSPSGWSSTSSHAGIGLTSLTASEIKTTPSSADTHTGKTPDMSVTAGSSPVTSSATVSTEAGQTTAPSVDTSSQDTSVSSQSQDAHGTETTYLPQNNMVTVGDTSTSVFSSRGHSPTAAVPPGTSPSGWSSPSPLASVSFTPLTTSEMTTASTSIDTGTGTTQDTSVTAGSSPVTSTAIVTTEPEGQTTAPSLGTSPQDTSASAQTHHTGRTETTGRSQASMLTSLSTASPASSPSPNTPTSGVPQGTSSSAGTAPSSHSGVGHTLLTTSEVKTAPPSMDTAVANTKPGSWSLTTVATPVSTTLLTTLANVRTTAPSSGTSAQDTVVSSQSQDARGTQTTRRAETSAFAVGDTSTSAFLLGGSSPTAGVPPGTPPLAEPTPSSQVTVSLTPLTTSEMTTAPTSIDTGTGTTQDTSVTAGSSPVTSTAIVTPHTEGQTTAPSRSSSPQDTSVSSESHHTGRTETTYLPQTNKVTGGDTSTSAFSSGESSPTAGVPPGTPPSAEPTTSSHASVGSTTLTTSEMVSLSRGSTSVSSATLMTTEANGQTTAPSSSTSAQDTAGSSQSQDAHGSETTKPPQTNMFTVGDTSTSAFSSGGHSPTAAVPPGTSPSGWSTPSPHDSVSLTPLTTSEMTTAPTSIDTGTGTTQDTSVTAGSSPVTSTAIVTTEAEGQTPAPSLGPSPQDTSASAQTDHTGRTEPTGGSQASMLTAPSTASPASSPSPNTPTSGVPQGTSSSAGTAPSSHSGAPFTSLTTSEMMSVTGISAPVSSGTLLTSKVSGQTTAPPSSSSAQDTAVSSQSQDARGTQTTRRAETSAFAVGDTSTSAFSLGGSSPTAGVPPGTPPSAEPTTSSQSTVGSTTLTTSEMMSLSRGSTSVSSATLMTTEANGQTTAPSSSTSAQDTAGSSQSQDAHGSETTKPPQTNMATGGDPSTSAFSSGGHSPTAAVPPGTSLSGWSTPSPHDSVSLTPLTTSEMTTAPTSIDTGTGTTQDMSVTAGSSPVTSTAIVTTEPEGQTPAPSLGPSPQDTSASAQTHHTGRTEPTGGSQASMLTAPSTASPASSPSPNTPTSGVPQGTSSSAGTAPSSHSSTGLTPLMTSEVKTTPPSTEPTAAKTGPGSWSLSTVPTPVSSATSLTNAGHGQTTAPPSSTSTQDSSVSSESQDIHGTQTTKPPQTNMVTGGDTSTSAFSSGESSPTAGVPPGTLPSVEPTTSSHASVGSITLNTSEVMSLSRGSTSVSSATLMTTEANGQTTAPSSSTSAQDTAGSSQSQDAHGSDTTKPPQTNMFTVGDTSTSAFSSDGHSHTAAVPPGTSPSGWSTPSPQASVSLTPLTTSEMTTAPTSIDTGTGTTQDTSVTAGSSPVTSTAIVTTEAEGQTPAPSLGPSPQDTSASAQTHRTGRTEPTGGSQASMLTAPSTASPASSPSPNTPTSGVPQGTSSSAGTAPSSHSGAGHTLLTTSETVTMPPSMDTAVANTEPGSWSLTTVTTPVSTTLLTTLANVRTTAPSSGTSAQDTAVSSQSQDARGTQTTRRAQTSTFAVGGPSTSAFSLGGSSPTAGLPQETSPSGWSTPSPQASVSLTPLTTSEMTTAPTSIDTGTGTTQDMSVTAGSSPVTSTAIVTPAPSLGPSLQDTSASAQTHHTGRTETMYLPQTNKVTGGDTSTSAFSSGGHSPTAAVPPGTSPSGGSTPSSHASVNLTPLTTSVIMTPPTSMDSITGKTQGTSASPGSPVTSTAIVTTDVEGQTTAPSFGPSPQDTSPSAQTHRTQRTEATVESKASIVPAVSTASPASSPSENTAASGIPQESSPSVPGPAVTRSSTTMVTSRPVVLSGTSTSLPSTASSSFTVKTGTSGAIMTSLRTDREGSTATSLSSTASQTLTPNATPGTSTGTSSTAASVPVKPEKGVSLFPYGSSAGDSAFVRKHVDFTSPLFEPEIGFPFGSSLRSFLYFTDNGQIIFPESKNQIFSYPHPPLGGFAGRDQLAVVAPFWDDADFSSHRGTIFYQEYETLYDYSKPHVVQQVESWIGKYTNTWNYKARWTLKVTWDSAPAYPAQRNLGTNTYQAILSTDGSRSFALFLYQSGGMQWDATQHAGSSVLMGFSSGDGHYGNSPLIFQPVWEKYRPDQFLNSDSGLRGLQVYKLHREERPNYRLRCLQRLRQPQWPSWHLNHVSCPCSWQQGRWDLRFQSIHIGWRDLGHRWLCSFSSWRGGVCCSYGSWGELRQGWRVQSPWHLEQELELRDWCCHWSDQPSFCSRYQQGRPPVSCAGYRPPRPAWMFGDPHITTLDGANYTFNGLGDFLLVKAGDGNSSFLLQGRTAQTHSGQATNFIAFAAQYNSSSTGPITVQWFLEPNDTIRVQLNNQSVTFEDVEGQKIFNTTGFVMTRNDSLVSASFDGTVIVSVVALSNILHASCSLPEEYRHRTEGLLGVWNGNPDDDFRAPNGTTISSATEEELFHYGMTWKIDGTSLLGKRDEHLPSNFTPVFFSQLWANNSLDKNLTSVCNGNKQCIYDTLATGSTSTGLHTKLLSGRYQDMNSTLNRFPPSIEGPHVVEAYMGRTKQVHYTSNSKDVTFTLRNNCPDFSLLENGTLLWTPNLSEPITLEILARNVRDNLSSVLQPKTVVCACKEEKQCVYNQTRRMGNSSMEVANCQCDENTFGHYCERSKDLCEEQCFLNVKCIPGQGCEPCPPNLTGDGRHCAPLEDSTICENKLCPANYCFNYGHCYMSPTPDCQPTCICPPAFTDDRCFLAGNNFPPTITSELPRRTIQLLLSEAENASQAEVNASVAYRLQNLDVRAFLRNSRVQKIGPPGPLSSGSPLQHWDVISEFQYRPQGPVINFLNSRLLDAVVEALLQPAPRGRWKRSEGPRNNVVFHISSRRAVRSLTAANDSTLQTHLKCSGYKGYHLAYSPQGGLTCVSPCSEGYCEHGGQCQHLPDGPRCSCVPFSIYMPWGERCEHLSLKLGAFFGILSGALGALLLLGVVVFVVLHFWGPKTRLLYSLDPES